MKHNIRPSGQQKNKLRTRLLWVAGITSSVFLITIIWLVYLNVQQVQKTKAVGNAKEVGGNTLNSQGEILTEFTWEKSPVTLATLGPDAIRVGKGVISAPGGRASTNGLSFADNNKGINLELLGTELFNQEGIDISIDFRSGCTDGFFFSRGQSLNFGLEKNKLVCNYRVDNGKGGYLQIKGNSGYEIPTDPIYRTYRFMYNPRTGKGELFVNSVMVWNNQGKSNQPLYWKNSGNIFIGKNIKGENNGRAILDNLVIRSTGSTSLYAESLLNFILEPRDQSVRVYWSSTMNDKIDHYIIERSINGLDFVAVTTLKANPHQQDEQEYLFTDKTGGAQDILYYRVKQVFQNGKFVVHPASAVKFKTEKGFAIDHISPLPFSKAFDVSYYIPQSGRVWVQLINTQGKIVATESFEAPKGKNVHVFRDQNGLQAGDYTLYVIFDNKKLSKKITKS